MKTQFVPKNAGEVTAALEHKSPPARSGAKTHAHRHERRKVREQLRHLDWALTVEE